ncbi:MAG TPA: hypothetical protein EYN95_06790, partial [Methylococcaceae bacterium]|nr:hypothetical protein [Methylococcaceae bacterium]
VNLHFKANFGSGQSRHVVTMFSNPNGSSDQKLIDQAKQAFFVTGHYGFNEFEQVNNNAFSFVFLREPISRLFSLYHFSKSEPTNNNPDLVMFDEAKKMNFLEFCFSDNPMVRSFVDNVQARTLAGKFPLGQDESYDKELILSQAITNLKKFDFVGLAETANEDLKFIASETNTIILSNRSRANANRTKGYSQHNLDMDDLRKQLAQVIDIDLKLYEAAKKLKFQ